MLTYRVGGLGQDVNLIAYGEADCDVTLGSSWQLQRGKVTIRHVDDNTGDCRFMLQSDEQAAVMVQKIALLSLPNFEFQPGSHTVLTARVSIGVSVQLIGVSRSGETYAVNKSLPQFSLQVHEYYTTRLELDADMRSIELWVDFQPLVNISGLNETRWCDDFFVNIDYGPDIVAPPRRKSRLANHK